jgi:hypothetical protein
MALRRVTFGGASSLDNYLAGKDDSMDWLLWSDELKAVGRGRDDRRDGCS